MAVIGENARYPDSFEVLGFWDYDPADPADRKFPGARFLVLFFVPDSEGLREGFTRVFDSLEFILLCSRPWRQSAIAVPPEKLSRADQLRISEILRARARTKLEASFWTDEPLSKDRLAPKNSFLQVPLDLLIDEPEL